MVEKLQAVKILPGPGLPREKNFQDIQKPRPQRPEPMTDDKEESAMFRLWAKIWKENHLLRDAVICDDSEDTRTHKVFHALDGICYQFDLGRPLWLDAAVKDFKRHSKARFGQDAFVEQIDFDYLEIQVIEED